MKKNEIKVSKKHDSAVALDKYRETDDYKRLINCDTISTPKANAQYLKNRIEAAYLKGWSDCQFKSYNP